MNEVLIQDTKELYCALKSDIIREVLDIDWGRNSNKFAVRHHSFYAVFQIIAVCATLMM